MWDKQQVIILAESLAKPFERFISKPYHDPVGYPTRGYGELLSRIPWEDLSKYSAVTHEQALIGLRHHMETKLHQLTQLVLPVFTTNQMAAMLDFTYNVGAGNFQISALRRKANRGDIDGAANEFKNWVYARNVKLPGLVRRREAERKLFLS